MATILVGIDQVVVDLQLIAWTSAALRWSWTLLDGFLALRVPMWMLLGAGAVAVILGIAVFRRSRLGSLHSKVEEQQEKMQQLDQEVWWERYRKDEIFGVHWAWRWTQTANGYAVDTESITPLCPGCVNELEWEGWPSRYKCTHCDELWGEDRLQNLSSYQLPKAIAKEIRRRIRTHDWKDAEQRLAEVA